MLCGEARNEIDRLIAAGDAQGAARELSALWVQDAGPAQAAFVVSRFERLRGQLPLLPYRWAILRSFTVEPIVPLLRASAFASRIDLAVHLGEFNAFAQEILEDTSALYRFSPDAAVLAAQSRDVTPSLWRDYASLSDSERSAAVDRVVGQFGAWVRAFRKHSDAALILHSLETPLAAARGVFDAQTEDGQFEAFHRVNSGLRAIAREYRGVYVLDYDTLVARHGREAWHDERKWLAVRLPVAAPHLKHLADEWMRFLHPLTGKLAKVLAVDLDNTLWGGVIGEDGLAGIQVGPEYPGAAYQELQRALLDLSRRGILLAVCSKNNPEDAMEALVNHPGMLLRPGDFAAMRINWNDKPRSLREIAAELNIGIDSVAFLDDSPVERQRVREEIPEAIVIELPADPMRFAQTVRDCPYFERLALSQEDRRRREYYAAETQRVEFERGATSKEEFYRSLDQEAEIAAVAPETLARVAQLTQKTNQFNLTTRRYSEQRISEIANCPGWRVWALRVRDRYADNGVVGVAITRDTGETCEIDTFLLSCRVIGRTVETALLAQLAADARSRGATRLEGWFLPTKKNAPAKDFYPNHGFHLAHESESGWLWSLDLTAGQPQAPPWIRIIRAAEQVGAGQ